MIAFFNALLLIAFYLFAMVILIQIKKDISIGNFTWGGGVIILALYTFFVASNFLPRQILVTLLMVLWGSRLIIQLYNRYKKSADPRFVTWQQEHASLLFFLKTIGWLSMGTLMLFVMAYPVSLTNISSIQPVTLGILDYCGLFIWLTGFIIEGISDYQLYLVKEKQTDKNAVLDTGLWRYSRHPNYFGEMLMWWGIWCIMLSVPLGWTTIISPLTITVLLLFFTGVPMLERAMENNPAYQEYKKHTSVLIPLPKWQ